MKKKLKRIRSKLNTLKDYKSFRWFSEYVKHQPNLWHFNRRTLAKGLAVGFFCAFIPVPFQTLLAILSAFIFRTNLPLAILAVWITNPITMPVIFYFAYKLGAIILNTSMTQNFNFSFTYFYQTFSIIWQPFLLGCLIFSIVGAILGYFIVHAIFRLSIYRHIYRKKYKNILK